MSVLGRVVDVGAREAAVTQRNLSTLDRAVLHEKLTSHFAHQAELIEKALFEESDV